MTPVHYKQSRRRFLNGIIIGVIATTILASFSLFDWKTTQVKLEDASIETMDESVIHVAFLSGDDDSQVEKALRLDTGLAIHEIETINASTLASFQAGVLVISNFLPDNDGMAELASFFASGGNLFLIPGPNAPGIANMLAAIGIGAEAVPSTNQVSTGFNYSAGYEAHPLVHNVQWSSCPSIRNYTMIENTNVTLENLIRARDDAGHMILGTYSSPSGGRLVIFTPWVVPGGNNLQIEVWPYFNYFVYLSTNYLGSLPGTVLLTYAEWPHSPVPHARDTLLITILVCMLGTTAFGLFAVQRHKSRRTQIQLSDEALKEITKEKEKEKQVQQEDLSDRWEQIGTHRQISGFLFGLFAGILLGIPQIVLTGIVFPRWIMPFPFVAGMFDWVKQFFQAIWMIFDVGTSIALAKFFAQYRIKQPEKAVHYIQIFVWWQMLSGVIQITMISLLGSIIFPQTNLAHLSWIVVLHSLIQYPGFFVVFIYIFQGMQRTDLQNLGNLLYQAVLMLVSQYVWILIFRFTFGNNPQGPAFWSAIGYAVGQYVAEWGIFFILMGFYKKLGFSVSTIFRVDFTGEELKEALIFGGKEALGHMWVPIAYMYQVWLISISIPNWTEEMGVYGYANMLMQVTALVGFLTEGFLAPVSEAHSHRKQKLLDFTIAQGLKWSSFIIMFMVALLAAVGAPFILIIGEQWAGAIRLIPLFLFYALWQPYAWLADRALAASGYTGLAAIIWIIEQGGKMVLLTVYVLLDIRIIEIILYAHIPVLIVKVTLSWVMIRRKVGRPKAYFWSSWIVPAIASIIMWAIFYALSLVLTGWLIIAEFVLAIFVFFFVYFFLLGFLGAFDQNTLEEFKKAADMVSKPVDGLARFMYKMTAIGASLNPKLHGRFPMDLFDAAMNEARDLEKEKLKLEI